MLKKANISWNARQLTKMIDKGSIVFDAAVQRGLVWDDERKSLLIHSMISGYPIPAMYATKDTETKQLSMLDGKQRSNAIHDFISGKFKLIGVPEVVLEDGTEIDINGMYFSGLNEDMQDIINNCSLTIYYYEDITDDEISEMFYRLNNGRALSSVELSRSRAKDLKTIQKIGKHELFTTSLTEKAFEKYTHEDLVIKSYIMLTSNNPCLDTKVVRPTMETAEFTDDIINLLNSVYDRILNTYKLIIADESPETGKISKRIAKRLITRTHMLSIMPIVKRSIDENVSDVVFANWVKNFFCGTKSATKYDEYNNRCASGSGHAENVKVRLKTIKKDYEKFMKQFNKTEETKEENVVKEESVENVVNDKVETTETVETVKVETIVATTTKTEAETETTTDTNTTETTETETTAA